ncbi:MAG: Propeptide PepSY amd peptidase [Bacillales bacterium]|jgi:predicted small secreted protein|nr:Propeptide PepSY amd peptidase [Bacillales bacterium]
MRVVFLKLGNLLLGFGIGAASTYLLLEKNQNKVLSSDRLLNTVKSQLHLNGKVVGSWICMVREKFSDNEDSTEAVRGGLTVETNYGEEKFEFYANPDTGSIIEIYQVS